MRMRISEVMVFSMVWGKPGVLLSALLTGEVLLDVAVTVIAAMPLYGDLQDW